MSGRPRLVSAAEPATPAAEQRSGGGLRLAWLLAALVVVCALGWAVAAREASQLTRELDATQSALAEVAASLRSIEAQRAEARTQLQALSVDANALAERLSALETLLATDPAAATDAQPMRSEGEPAP